MTDKARVIVASTPKGNEKRIRLLPEGLYEVMKEILASDYDAIGRESVSFYGSPKMARKDRYIITRDENFQAPGVCKVIHDYM